jgi:hypothetical protein
MRLAKLSPAQAAQAVDAKMMNVDELFTTTSTEAAKFSVAYPTVPSPDSVDSNLRKTAVSSWSQFEWCKISRRLCVRGRCRFS